MHFAHHNTSTKCYHLQSGKNIFYLKAPYFNSLLKGECSYLFQESLILILRRIFTLLIAQASKIMETKIF